MIGCIVYGPEASGTRYVTGLLEAANWNGNPLLRRSIPYDRAWPPLNELLAEIDRNDTRVVVTSRRADVLALSQVKNGHAADWREALVQIQRAYGWAFGECQALRVPFLLTSYESFSDPAYRCWVTDWAWDTSDHEAAMGYGFEDGNEKYL